MNQKTIIWVLVVIAAVILGWYLFFYEPATTPQGEEHGTGTQENQNTNGTAGGNTTGGEDLAGILARGCNYSCTFDSTDQDSRARGTLYVQGDKVRLDFESEINNEGTVQSHMLRTGGWFYIWTGASGTTGFKLLANESSLPGAISTSLGGAVTSNGTATSWQCRPWVPVASQFSVPEGITFATAPSAQ